MANFWQSKHVRLRAVEPGDAETFQRWNTDSDRARYLDFLWPPSSLASQQAWAEEQSKKKFEGDSFHWLIETLDGTPVGTIASHHCDPHNGTFSYGFDIAEEHRRKGYAGEAAWLVMRYYFHQFRYQKATVEVHSDNIASIRLHEKLGFQHEGTLRRMVFQNGQFLDILYYGLTVEEFQELDRRRNEAE